MSILAMNFYGRLSVYVRSVINVFTRSKEMLMGIGRGRHWDQMTLEQRQEACAKIQEAASTPEARKIRSETRKRWWASLNEEERTAYLAKMRAARDPEKLKENMRAHRQVFQGEANYSWKGDAAKPDVKRKRARRLYALGPCEQCGKPAFDRHHKDGDTGNNTPENVAILCRRCHMKTDGRLEALHKLAEDRKGKIKKAPSPCAVCGRLAKPLRKGKCHACNEFFRRNGVDRTPDDERPRRECHERLHGIEREGS
jgi:hypothetical protein